MIDDIFDLAAAYAVAIAAGHVFNDGKKRTSFETINFCLVTNGVQIAWDTSETGDTIIKVAQGLIDQETLAQWLRSKAPISNCPGPATLPLCPKP